MNKKDIEPETQEAVIKTIGSNARLAGADAVRETVRILVNFSLGQQADGVRAASIENVVKLASRATLAEAETSEVKRAILKMLDESSERIVNATIEVSRVYCGDERIRDKLTKFADQSTDPILQNIAKTTLDSEDCFVD